MQSPMQFQAHPWHGIRIHKDSPELVLSFIEIVPSDTVKYEVDKESGHLKVDRPQIFSIFVRPITVLFLGHTAVKKSRLSAKKRLDEKASKVMVIRWISVS